MQKTQYYHSYQILEWAHDSEGREKQQQSL